MHDGQRDRSAHPTGIRRLFRIRFTLRGVHAEVRDEIRFHLESRVEDLIARGLTPAAARDQAKREYGDVTQSEHELLTVDRHRHDRHERAEVFSAFFQDLKYAVRGLIRRPALAAITVFALTLGIGANAVMFGVIDQLLLRPPVGVAAPAGVRRIYFRTKFQTEINVSPTNTYRVVPALRAGVPEFSDVAGFYRTTFTLGRGRDANTVDAQVVSGNYFHLLGVQPQLGRAIRPDEDVAPNGARVVVLSDGFWKRELGGRTDVIGEHLELNRNIFTVVGVAPRGFGDLDRHNIDLWVPIASIAGQLFGDDWYRSPNTYWVSTIARVRPDATPGLATAHASVAYRREQATWGMPMIDSVATVVLGPLVGAQPNGVSAEAKVSLWLMGVSVLVLIIACANVANLLIARTLDRRREIAVRLALGINRGRLLRQLLTEAALLSAVAGAAALVAVHWAAQLVQRVLLPGIVWNGSVVDWRVLAFTLAAAMTCILLCGLAPAIQGIRANVADSLKASSRQIAGDRGILRNALLVTQAALSVLLLVGAGLFVRSLRNVSTHNVGITLDHVLLVTMNLKTAGFASTEIGPMFNDGAVRVRAIPGVQQAAVIAATVPLRGARAMSLHPIGMAQPPKLAGGGPYYAVVTNDFFAASGARIVSGRAFTSVEERSLSRPVIINEIVAKAYWPDHSPIGQCVRLGADSTCSTVVGVVQNVMLFSMVNDDRAMIYIPPTHPAAADEIPAAMIVRTAGDAAAVVPLVRGALAQLSPNMPYVAVAPFSDLVAPQLRPWRLGATMFTIFGLVALAIAAVGLYSVMAYWVAQRRHEIGVRMALGAQRGDVVRLVMHQASRPIAAGLILGIAAAAVASHWVTTLLYETSAHDPFVYCAAAGILAIAAITAAIVPARRSTAVDPATALRAE
ncbi:MAG TPA: ABC transporter permease [Gemmatimonadaceae bacterium]|jgi:predicted permease